MSKKNDEMSGGNKTEKNRSLEIRGEMGTPE